jgi:hypothetical protein
MTIHIYYRHTSTQRSHGKMRPEWFSHEKCFANLLSSIEPNLRGGQVQLHLVFDGSESEMQADFVVRHLNELSEQHDDLRRVLHGHRISGGDQRKAWRAAVKLVKAHCEDGMIHSRDLIYLLENDYVHRLGWIREIERLSQEGIHWDYLTLYDHPDKYPDLCRHGDSKYYRRLRTQLFATSTHHWRTIPSTCATYLLSRETFLRDHILLKMGIYDFRLFWILTKIRRRRLLSPIPAFSTHCMWKFLSPCIDWRSEIDPNLESRIN